MKNTISRKSPPKEGESWVLIFLAFSGFIVVLIGLVWSLWFFSEDKIKDATKSYWRAYELCGKDNLKEHNYTDGSTDFTCADYSKVK